MIETERLLLRMPQLDDADALGEPHEKLERWIAEWESTGLGYFTVLCDEVVVGRVGFHTFDPVTWTLADAGETELGWTLVEAHRRNGYATEAARAARAWAARDRVISLIEPSNEASARVARRLGATPTETVVVMGDPCVVWVHPA